MSATRIVNARKLAVNRSELQGSVPIQALSGVHERLADTVGELNYRLYFHSIRGDEGMLPVVRVNLRAEVSLQCQRSMQPFRQLVKSESQVVLVADEKQAETLGDEYEPFACADDELNINALLGEELLLALPLVAIDPKADPPATAGAEQNDAGEQEQHPFAGLAAIKTKLAAAKD